MFRLSRNYTRRIILNILIMLSALAVTMLLSPDAYAKEPDTENGNINGQILDEQSNSGEVEKIEKQLDNYANKDFKELMKEFDPEKILKDSVKGNFEFSITGFINRILSYIFKEIYFNINIMLKLIVIIILCAMLKNLQASFLSQSVGELAFYTCYIVMVSILIVGFNSALQLAQDVIDKMVGFMQATIPVLITLMISGGNITSAGIFHPILIMIVQIAAAAMKNIIIPLIFLSNVLSIVNNISDKVQLSKLAGLLKQISGWMLGVILTIFIAVISVQGSLGAVVDGVTSKTAKFAIGAFIPVAGKYLADAADAVIGCALLIKNAAGVAAMIGILSICLVPLLKIFAIMAIFKITCVLAEPVAEKRITGCINDIAGSLTFIIGVVASVAIMFLVSITAIISTSNISAMIR